MEKNHTQKIRYNHKFDFRIKQEEFCFRLQEILDLIEDYDKDLNINKFKKLKRYYLNDLKPYATKGITADYRKLLVELDKKFLLMEILKTEKELHELNNYIFEKINDLREKLIDIIFY